MSEIASLDCPSNNNRDWALEKEEKGEEKEGRNKRGMEFPEIDAFVSLFHVPFLCLYYLVLFSPWLPHSFILQLFLSSHLFFSSITLFFFSLSLRSSVSLHSLFHSFSLRFLQTILKWWLWRIMMLDVMSWLLVCCNCSHPLSTSFYFFLFLSTSFYFIPFYFSNIFLSTFFLAVGFIASFFPK